MVLYSIPIKSCSLNIYKFLLNTEKLWLPLNIAYKKLFITYFFEKVNFLQLFQFYFFCKFNYWRDRNFYFQFFQSSGLLTIIFLIFMIFFSISSFLKRMARRTSIYLHCPAVNLELIPFLLLIQKCWFLP